MAEDRFGASREARLREGPAPPLKGRSGRLGFLGGWPFGCENPSLRGLEKLGFPWILSSETSLFNALHGIFAEKKFARSFGPRGGSAGRAPDGLGIAKRRIGHGASLPYLLIFCKRLSPLSFPLSRLDLTHLNSRTGGGRHLDRRTLGQEPRAFIEIARQPRCGLEQAPLFADQKTARKLTRGEKSACLGLFQNERDVRALSPETRISARPTKPDLRMPSPEPSQR